MAAELDFNRGREPAQPEPIPVSWHQECRFSQVHFGRHVLHPGRIGRDVEQADRRRVAAKGLVREGIDLKKSRHVVNLHLE